MRTTERLPTLRFAIAGHVRTDAAHHVSVLLPDEAIAVLRTDSSDTVYFRVTGPSGEFLAGDRDLPTPVALVRNPAFHDVTFRSQRVRLATYRTATSVGDVTITVGETLHKRQDVRDSLLVTMLGADLLELGLILALVWIAVGLALQPLNELRTQVAARSPRDLEPIASSSVPIEVRTVVDELNRLFATIALANRSQQQFLEARPTSCARRWPAFRRSWSCSWPEEPRETTRERLALTLGATRRLSHTTQQLLALARSEHAASTFSEFRPVDLASIAESCITDFVTRGVAAGLDLGAELEPAPVEGSPGCSARR